MNGRSEKSDLATRTGAEPSYVRLTKLEEELDRAAERLADLEGRVQEALFLWRRGFRKLSKESNREAA